MKNITTVLILLIACNCVAQKQARYDSTALNMFNRGVDYLDNGKDDSALAIWTKIVEKKIGIQYNVYGNAFFNVASVYWKMGKLDKAKEWYSKIIASDLKDSDIPLDPSEPHSNYKHKSAVALAGICSMQSNFPEALNWILRADTQYLYWGIEGSAASVSEEESSMLSEEADILMRLRKKDETIHAILFQLICAGNQEAAFQDFIPKLYSLVDRKTFKKDIDQALDKLTIDKVGNETWMVSFVLSGQTYKVPVTKTIPDKNVPHYHHTVFADKNQVIGKKFVVDYVSGRNFYKSL